MTSSIGLDQSEGQNSASVFHPLQVPLNGVQLIEASAGTGKTWNISALYLRALIERQITVEQLLVVTFTKAATAELRDRIRLRIADLYALISSVESLDDWVSAPDTDPFLVQVFEWLKSCSPEKTADLKPRLKLALQSFDQATIFTIHGFCQRALDDAPFVSGSPIGSELITDDAEIRDELIQDYWRCKVLAPDADEVLVWALSQTGQSPKTFSHELKRCLAKPLARLIWPDEDGNREVIQQNQTLLSESWEKLKALWLEDSKAIIDPVREAIRQEHFNKNTFKTSSLLKSCQDWSLVVQSGPKTRVQDSKLHLLRADKLKPTKEAQKKGATAPEHAFYIHAQDYLDAKAKLDQQADLISRWFLREVLETLVPQIKKHKRALRIYSFDDMLANLRDALIGPQGEALAQFLRTKFPIALVDEFQDTDPLQLAILEKIYTGHDQVATLFLVGDPKQAIYSFRNADLPTYLRARGQASQCWTLTENQRASQALIDACNSIFTQRSDAFLQSGLRYHPVRLGVTRRKILEDDSGERAPLNIYLLPRDDEGHYFSVNTARQRAAQSCATEIVQLLNSGQDNRLRIDGRGVQAGDIAVLVRSHYEGLLMRQALEQRGVACVERSPMNIFKTPDAQEWLCLLRALADPRHVGKVLSALATRMLHCDAQDILALKQSENELERRMAQFKAYHDLWIKRGLGPAIRHALNDFKVFETLLAAPDGPRRMTNLQHLMEWLQDVSRVHQGPLALLRVFENALQGEQGHDEQEQRLETDAHLVQIMTIHRSKGLEFPIVFCPFIWTTSGSDKSNSFAREYHDADDNTVLDYRDRDSIAKPENERIKEKQDQARDAEYVRLIYVALTRASLRCYLVAGVFSGQSKEDPTSIAFKTPLNRLIESQTFQPASTGLHPIEQRWFALAQSSETAKQSMKVQTLPEALSDSFKVLNTDHLEYSAEDPPPKSTLTGFRMDSFSGLQRHAEPHQKSAMESDFMSFGLGKDHDELDATNTNEDPEEVGETDHQNTQISRTDILKFPRGKHEGTFLHQVLEHADLAQEASWPDLIKQTLDVFSHFLNLERKQITPDQATQMVLGMLSNIADYSLPQGFKLKHVSPDRQIAEMEFYLPSRGVSSDALCALLRRHGVVIPRYQFDDLEGYLKGFIDLVFEHQGRWYVLDWKSNHLGETPRDYASQSVQSEMDHHGYVLQAVLYSLALHRLLKQRVLHYQPQQHLGGALYVFLRGLREEWRSADSKNPTPGLWTFQPSQQMLTDLDALFEGRYQGEVWS